MAGTQRVYVASRAGSVSSWGNGGSKFTVAVNAGTADKTTGAGMLCRAAVTTTGTAAAAPGLVFSDGPAGTVIGAIPGNATAGQSFTFMMPVDIGISVVQPANGPVCTCSYEASP